MCQLQMNVYFRFQVRHMYILVSKLIKLVIIDIIEILHLIRFTGQSRY